MKKELLIITFFGMLLTSAQILKCALTTEAATAQSPDKKQIASHPSTEIKQPNPDLDMWILSESKQQAITELLTSKEIEIPEDKRFTSYKRRAHLVDIALWEKPRSIFKRNNKGVDTVDLGSQLLAALVLAHIGILHTCGTTPELRSAAAYGAGIGFISQIFSTFAHSLEDSEQEGKGTKKKLRSNTFSRGTKKASPRFSLNPVLTTTMVFPAMIFIAQSLKNFKGFYSIPHELITAPVKKSITNLWGYF